MSADLTHLAAASTRAAFEKTASVWLESGGELLTSILRSRIPVVVANASGAFAVEFASVLMKGLLQHSNSSRQIEKAVSKLAKEPVKTALEQFRVASSLQPASSDAEAHQEHRFRECLLTLDRALSVADDSEISMIHLLRGACALQVRGAEDEAKQHLRVYMAACAAKAEALSSRAERHEEAAKRSEAEAGRIQIPMGQGVGGGFLGMAVAEPRIRKSSLLHEAASERKQAGRFRTEAEDLTTAAECARAVVEIASKPA